MEISARCMPLYHQIKGSHRDAQSFAYWLEYLTFHLPIHLIEPALMWLVKNGITEERFLVFVEGECRKSGLELIRHLTMRLEREKRTRTLTVKDFQ